MKAITIIWCKPYSKQKNEQMNQVKIRPYKDSDWQRLCEIHDKARMDELRLSVGKEAFLTLEQTFKSEGLFDGKVLIATIKDIQVGFVAYQPEEITWLYVHPTYYRRGIGRKLLQAALKSCQSKVSIVLLVENLPALYLYQSIGFKVIARKKGKLSGNKQFDAEAAILVLDTS